MLQLPDIHTCRRGQSVSNPCEPRENEAVTAVQMDPRAQHPFPSPSGLAPVSVSAKGLCQTVSVEPGERHKWLWEHQSHHRSQGRSLEGVLGPPTAGHPQSFTWTSVLIPTTCRVPKWTGKGASLTLVLLQTVPQASEMVDVPVPFSIPLPSPSLPATPMPVSRGRVQSLLIQ